MEQAPNGRLVLAGSTAAAPLLVEAARRFAITEGVDIDYTPNGSWFGIAEALSGSAIAAVADIDTAEFDRKADLYPLTAYALAFLAHPAAKIDNLSASQLVDVLMGRIDNWKQIGGADCTLQIVNRNRASGVRNTIEQKVLSGMEIGRSRLTVDDNQDAAKAARDVRGAIAYVALPEIRDNGAVRVSIDGAQATSDEVLAGRYPLWAYGRLLSWQPMPPYLERFVKYVAQPELAESLGYIPVHRMSALQEMPLYSA